MTQAEPGGLPYHRIHRALARPGDSWRPILGVVTLAFGVVVLAPFVVLAAFSVGYAVTGADVEASLDRLIDTDNVTPAGLAYVFLVLASAIPVTWAISRVAARAAAALAVLGRAAASAGAGSPPASGSPYWRSWPRCWSPGLLPDQGGAEMSGELNDFTSTTRDFALVVLLLTPLQAAGEEYAFRGYLTQAFGGLIPQRRGSRSSSPPLLFALAHGLGQSWPIFFDRFAFGLVAGTLVILHRRPGGRHRHARAEQLAGLRAGPRLRRHELGAQPDRRHLVEHPGDPHPVPGLPRSGGAGEPPDRAADETETGRFGGLPRARVRFPVGSSGARERVVRRGRTPVRQWDMV